MAHFLACLLGLAAGIEPLADLVVAGSLRLTVEVVGDAPLPRQAVRLRATVTNAGPFTARDMTELHIVGLVTGVRGPRDRAVRPGRPGAPLDREPQNPWFGGNPLHAAVFTLRPGESRSVTLPFALDWGDPAGQDPDHPPDPTPLFPEPGDYLFECQYGPRAAVRVVVRQPDPKRDGVWAAALAADPALTRVLLDPTARCTADQAKWLAALLAKYPDSSYAHYGRLSLGRFHDPAVSFRVNFARQADVLGGACGPLAAGFAYGPHAELALADRDPGDGVTFKRRMVAEYRDAGEWLREVAPRLSREEWDALRRPPPAPKK